MPVYYEAGNVGGIVGYAEKTNISNVTNKENQVLGSHNVGGIAGFFGTDDHEVTTSEDKKYTITNATNNGGEIMATGARDDQGNVVKENIRLNGEAGDQLIIGNIGGIVGYLYGDHSYITDASNRGTVHTYDIPLGATPVESSQAANVGGIVGKVDRTFSNYVKENNLEGYLEAVKGSEFVSTISGSYNTGDVRGYSNIGGIVGFMYNGEIKDSYNLGALRTTRVPKNALDSTNMGGILGDTLERSKSRVILYNVYNKGQIGEHSFEHVGRHVGGIVGRFAGVIDTAYNSGIIYNGAQVTGGIAGYWNGGIIQNVFNTGNVTVKTDPKNNLGSEALALGGIVGMTRGYVQFFGDSTNGKNTLTLQNAYNLGALRSFDTVDNNPRNAVSGIVGFVRVSFSNDNAKFLPYQLNISNVYTVGNMWAGKGISGSYTAVDGQVHGILSSDNDTNNGYQVAVEKAYYIKPDDNSGFINVSNTAFTDGTQFKFDQDSTAVLSTADSVAGQKDKFKGFGDTEWRFYDKTTPILNAFMPKLGQGNNQQNAGLQDANIQFGTAYNPFLSIISDKGNVTIDNAKDYINNWDSIAVYGGGLTLNGFTDVDGRMYGGTLYSDGALVVNDHSKFGAASHLYGSSVTIGSSTDTKLDLKINGTIQATGNADGSTIKDDKNGQVNITDQSVQSVESYGTISSAENGQKATIDGIKSDGSKGLTFTASHINDPTKALPTVASQYGHTTEKEATSDGVVTITADGDVNLLYGNMHQGIVNAYGGLDVTSKSGAIYIDSDLNAGGKVTLTGDHEMVLDVSNIGKVSNPDDTVGTLHKFLDKTTVEFSHVTTNDKNPIDGKIAIDMSSDDGKTLDFKKYDTPEDGNTPADTLAEHIKKLNANLKFNGQSNQDDQGVVKVNAIYNWISNADQLKDIQTHYEKDSQSDILGYNFALKNNIDASGITDYKAIGDGKDQKAYTGIFDGRDQRLIGLSASEGIFGTIGDKGTVKNLKVYSSGVNTGMEDGGVIAKTNNGTISNIIGLGNTVSGKGTIGGLVGTNTGTIQNSSDQSSVIGAGGTVGGLAGTNQGKITGSMTNSAITGSGSSMGGIAGTNDTNGIIYNVSSNGVSGETGSTNIGGIVGANSAKTEVKITVDGTEVSVTGISNAYNNSVIRGTSNIGGIIGTNSGSADNVANGSSISGETNAGENIGGLAGTNSGSITDGRNTGTITGNKNVGGLVGVNESGSTLTNLENGSSASIKGTENVGGIAGTNKGSINAEDSELTNEGIIKGNTYVGGVAGTNEGTIKGVHSDITLQVNTDDGKKDGEYFGGIAGWNKSNGTITNATNTADINALTEEEGYGVSYVGGIAGRNDGALIDAGNSGNVTGKSFVGGVAGLNTRDLKGYKDGDNNASTQEDILIQNSGNVTATQGGAGGIFGENQGTIGDDAGNKHIILSNSGNVTGKDEKEDQGTGGIIGVNKGDISHTSLRNEVKWDEASKQYTPGKVTGTNNVGGVIGLNYGNVSGGRNVNKESILDKDGKEIGTAAAESYYKYQILNNGAVSGASNIGGLVGKNISGETKSYKKNDGTLSETLVDRTLTGEIHAGYNTGSVTADGKNVGGIVGTNANGATVDQVFSTLAEGNAVGSSTEVVENVGGIIGDNEGTLMNAYATHTVNGKNESTGNAVGTNSGTISNVYSSATSGKLIGENANTTGDPIKNVYSYSTDDTTVTVLTADNQKKQSSYGGFDFNGVDGKQAIWKLYDEKSNPLLKVFLTTVTATNNIITDTYKGSEFTADYFREHAGLNAANGKNFAEDDNTEGALLHVKDGIIDAGEYKDIFYSQQIATNGKDGSPNNLGYDIDVDLTVNKKELTVTGTDVKRTYGDKTITNGDYGVRVDGWVGREDGKDHSGDYSFDSSGITDGALADGANGRVTNDVGEYVWENGTVTLTNADISKNYTLNATVSGKSYVEKANLTIHADDTYVPVGIKPHYSGTVDKLVNGDQWDAHFGIDSSDKPKESQVGVYHGIIGLWVDGTFHGLKENDFTEGFLKNYNITLEPGTLTVGDWPSWDYFLKDAPWDRQKNFRERKAEIHFIAGGMTL